MDNFEQNFNLFVDRCNHVKISDDDRPEAFPIMLTKQASTLYQEYLRQKNLSRTELADAMKERFQRSERKHASLHDWDSLSLKPMFESNAEKSPVECLKLLIMRLSEIQSSLPTEHRNDTILQDKLLNATREVDACLLAYHKPSDTLQGVILDLHAPLATHSCSPKRNSSSDNAEPVVHYVDRRYRRDRLYDLRFPRQHDNDRDGNRQKICFVCKKPGCWSTNHSTKDRLTAFRGNKVLKQFLATMKLQDNESDEDERELSNALENVVINLTEGGDNTNPPDTDENHQFAYIATFTDEKSTASFVASIQTISVMHSLTKKILKRRGDDFDGILIDTGAAMGSTCGRAQFKAYCRPLGLEPATDASRAATCHFGIGSAKSDGVAKIDFPLGPIWMAFDVHVVNCDIPMLLLIADMDRLGIFYKNILNKLLHPASGLNADVVRLRGHPYLRWNEQIVSHFTFADLRRLHRRFGHPYVDKLVNVLKRADFSSVNAETRHMLEHIERSCIACQEYAQRPRTFRFTLRDDVDFNHTVYADVFYIDGKPVLHVVDEATRFQAARWLSKMSSENLWLTLRRCWKMCISAPGRYRR